MPLVKDLIVLEEVNPERFSKMISTLSVDDPTSYNIVIDVVTTSKGLSGAAKTNFGKKNLDLSADLIDAIDSYVRFVPEVNDEW